MDAGVLAFKSYNGVIDERAQCNLSQLSDDEKLHGKRGCKKNKTKDLIERYGEVGDQWSKM